MIAGELFKMKVIDTIKDSLILETPYFLVDSGKDTLAIVLNRRGMDQQQVYRIGQRSLDIVNLEAKSECTMGVGRACSSILYRKRLRKRRKR